MFRWFCLSLAGLLLAAGITAWSASPNLQVIAAMVGIFVLLPLAIVTYNDAARRVARELPSGRTVAIVLSLPIRLLGAACLLSGLAITGWLGYNILIAKQAQFTGVTSPFQLLVPVVLVIIGWRWLRRPLAQHSQDEAA